MRAKDAMLQPMMTDEQKREPLRQLLAEIDAFCARNGMSPTRFGQLALNDGHFVKRLRKGKDVQVTRWYAARRFMEGYKPSVAHG